MKIDTTAVAHLLAALTALLVAAHALGGLFARFRQPRVIGEIVAGLVLPVYFQALPSRLSRTSRILTAWG